MEAIGYVRVSTEKQADFGVSLEAQTAKIRAMAVVQGAELVDVLVDAGESAKSLHRPGMARLLALVDAGAIDTVIIAKLDRLVQNQPASSASRTISSERRSATSSAPTCRTAMAMVGHKTESIYRRYSIVDQAMLEVGASKRDQLQQAQGLNKPVVVSIKRKRAPTGR